MWALLAGFAACVVLLMLRFLYLGRAASSPVGTRRQAG
jgi:hypothetical protein